MTVVHNDTEVRELIEAENDRTGGIFRLAPSWVGRPGIVVPGRRIKLWDIYMSQDVAVNERWLASTTCADNGVYNEACPVDHGLSYIVVGNREVLLRRAIELLPDLMLGDRDRTWDVLPKLFDNKGRIPNHLHPCQHHVRDGLNGKPESYHFPVELNLNRNDHPASAFGVDRSLTDDQLLSYLRRYSGGDNHCTDLGPTFNILPGTGWYTPPCTLHAPGSLATYELQVASDVTCIPESRVNGVVMPVDLLDRDLPVTVSVDGEEAVAGYILSMLRCPNSGNADDYRAEYFRPPVLFRREPAADQEFVIYRTGRTSEKPNPDLYSAKHSVVHSGARLHLEERGAFGAILLAGHGSITVPGRQAVSLETQSVFYTRDQIGADEVFLTADAARDAVLQCDSVERLSLYQHFASHTNHEAGELPVPEFDPFRDTVQRTKRWSL